MYGSGLLAVLPWTPTRDPFLTYNAVVVSWLWLSACAMYALVFYWTRNPAASFAAGCLFASTHPNGPPLIPKPSPAGTSPHASPAWSRRFVSACSRARRLPASTRLRAMSTPSTSGSRRAGQLARAAGTRGCRKVSPSNRPDVRHSSMYWK